MKMSRRKKREEEEYMDTREGPRQNPGRDTGS
jgi:hypothetical protein